MNHEKRRTRWLCYTIYRDDPRHAELLDLAFAWNVEVYQHGGKRPHWHCLAYSEPAKFVESWARQLGLNQSDDYGVPAQPDVTRRYFRRGGTRLYG